MLGPLKYYVNSRKKDTIIVVLRKSDFISDYFLYSKAAKTITPVENVFHFLTQQGNVNVQPCTLDENEQLLIQNLIFSKSEQPPKQQILSKR